MSLSQDAIKELDDKSVVGKQIEQIFKCDTPLVALPSDYNIHSLENYMDQRARFRAKFSTSVLSEFIKYTNDNDDASCFINTRSMNALSIFDLGDYADPGHAENTASLSLNTTSPYDEAISTSGQTFSQKGFAEWLEDWRLHISPINQNGDDYDIKQAISAVRKLTIEASQKSDHADSDLNRSRSAVEMIEAKSENPLPMSFTFSCKPYEDLKERQIYFRVSIITSHTEPRFTLRIIQLEKLREEMLMEFREKLQAGFNEEIQVYLGSINTD